jgi:hypothetical protein
VTRAKKAPLSEPKTCGKCGAVVRPTPKQILYYAVRVGDQWIQRFTHAQSITKKDEAWEKSPGIRFAQCVKAILGDVPFVWPNRPDSAQFVAAEVSRALVFKKLVGELVDGIDVEVVWLCDPCAA